MPIILSDAYGGYPSMKMEKIFALICVLTDLYVVDNCIVFRGIQEKVLLRIMGLYFKGIIFQGDLLGLG